MFNNISYADNKVLIAASPQKLQQMVHRLNKESKKFGMATNTKKTEVMLIEESASGKSLHIEIEGHRLKQVKVY